VCARVEEIERERQTDREGVKLQMPFWIIVFLKVFRLC